jgi:hypothetical protein
MKMMLRLTLLALALANVHSSTTCGDSDQEQLVAQTGNGPQQCGLDGSIIELDENDLPIQIISQNHDGSEVTFGVVQNLFTGSVSKLALNYHSGPEEIACTVTSDVAADSTETYTAACFDGKASVKLYLHFCDSDAMECDYCEVPEDKDDYMALSFELECYQPCEPPAPAPTTSPQTESGDNSGSLGDPHFKSWQGEHFEYHGQCDLVLATDKNFADGLGLDVQIRTKLVRFWSYIDRAAIRIGNDILEIEGVGDLEENEIRYWFNLEYKSPTTSIGGFPLTIHNDQVSKTYFEIDLSSKYPGQKIVLSTFREFVRVDFHKASSEAFGNAVGMLGDFATGIFFARDGATMMDDFVALGNEWQVLPSDNMLFHDAAVPQFPARCIEPEDPRGERRRRLDESTVSLEQAEAACSKGLTNPLDIKDCVYDVLATQDLDMVGAF